MWLSVDGLRPDYLDRADTPLLKRMMREGAHSRQVVTVVPSLTFPSHMSQATGVGVSEHGIPANAFYDAESGEALSYPHLASLVRAEPIWLTAPRQGVRTLVFDWPLSQEQAGPVRSDYFLPKFDKEPTDEQRLSRLLDTWRGDTGEKPLQLLMGYVNATDVAGHKFGPDSREAAAALEGIDAQLQRFVDDAVTIFRAKMRDGDELYVVLTTDHGMMPVHTLVNIEKLFAAPPPRQVRIVTSGPTAMIHLDQVPQEQRAALAAAMLRDLGQCGFLSVYARGEVPKHWNFEHQGRTGDICVFLKPGFDFSKRLPLATFPMDRVGSPRGAHGYVPEQCPEMRGFCVLWRYPQPLGRRDLGEVRVEQFHPTVAKLLNIVSADGAKAPALQVKRTGTPRSAR